MVLQNGFHSPHLIDSETKFFRFSAHDNDEEQIAGLSVLSVVYSTSCAAHDVIANTKGPVTSSSANPYTYPRELSQEGIRSSDRMENLSTNDDVERWRDLLLQAVRIADFAVIEKFLKLYSSLDDVGKLVHTGLLYDTRNEYGFSLMHIAVENGHKRCVNALVRLEHLWIALKVENPRSTQLQKDFTRSVLSIFYLYRSRGTHSSFSSGVHDPFDLATSLHREWTEYLKNMASTSLKRDVYLKDFFGDATYEEEDSWHVILPMAFGSGDQEILQKLKDDREVESKLLQIVFSIGVYTYTPRKLLQKLLQYSVRYLRLKMVHSKSYPHHYTPLHVATLYQREDTMLELLEWYAQEKAEEGYVNWELLKVFYPRPWGFSDAFSLTPLHYAVLMKSEKFVRLLLNKLEAMWDVYSRDSSLRTPLHMACIGLVRGSDPGHFQPSEKIIELLCGSVYLRNAVDCCKFTPLHWAVHMKSTEVVQLLLERFRVRTTEKNRDGMTVLKYAVESVNIDGGFTDIESSRSKTMDILRTLKSSPGIKDELDLLYRDRQVFVDAANAILVGAALIASVTYGGWLQPPLGDDDDTSRKVVRIFWVFNSLSFSFAIATVLAGAGAVMPMTNLYIEDAVERVRYWLGITSLLLLLAVLFVLGAFWTAGFASSTQIPDLQMNMIATTVLGTAVCVFIGLFYAHGLAGLSSGLPWKKSITQGRKTTGSARDSVVDLERTWQDRLKLSEVKDEGNFLDLLVLGLVEVSLSDSLVQKVDFRELYSRVLPRVKSAVDREVESDHDSVASSFDFRQGGIQHAILKIPHTSSCRDLCITRDAFLLKRGLQKITREEWNIRCNQGEIPKCLFTRQ